MKLKSIFLLVFTITAAIVSASEIRYVGGDISLFPTYQEAGSKYKDENGKDIDLLPYLHEIGMNAMRVRLFVDPVAFQEKHPNDYDPNACQSLPYIIPLCQEILNNGFELMLDFHYSDTWADPGAQWIPDSWKDLSDAELEQKIYDYTKETLITLKENNITPKFIQPGNEISYGMLWAEYGNDIPGNHVYNTSSNASWQRFGDFLKAAINACREICSDSEIVIHTERVAQVNVLTNFYDKMSSLNIDYDIIGLSYYPYFHGNMKTLDNALTTLENKYPEKSIMIVETGYPYAWEVPGTSEKVDYPYTYAGQNAFAQELVDTLLSHKKVNGLFWWWLEYNAYGTQLKGWYNAPLFDSQNGKATPALKTIASFGNDAGIDGIMMDKSPLDGSWYDINGIKVASPNRSGFYIHNGEKIYIKNK